MIDLVIIIIGFNLAFWFEAIHDYMVILNEADLRAAEDDSKYKKEQQARTRKWHRMNFYQWVAVSVVVGMVYINRHLDIYCLLEEFLPIVLILGSLRVLMFNIKLNYLRKRDWNDLGDYGVEGWFDKRGWNTFYYSINLIIFLGGVTWLMIKLN